MILSGMHSSVILNSTGQTDEKMKYNLQISATVRIPSANIGTKSEKNTTTKRWLLLKLATSAQLSANKIEKYQLQQDLHQSMF